jgi:hypothetical protein
MSNIWIPILSIMVVIYIVVGIFLIRFLKNGKQDSKK